MSIERIRAAFETHLSGMTPALPTAFENMPFTPVSGTPYQKAFLLPANPENPTLGDGYYREIGIFQVTLCYPQGAGPALAQARAASIQTRFKRGLTLNHSGTNIHVQKTPYIGPAMIDGDRYCLPVSIRYYAEFFN